MGKHGWFMSQAYTVTSPPREGEPAGTIMMTMVVVELSVTVVVVVSVLMFF